MAQYHVEIYQTFRLDECLAILHFLKIFFWGLGTKSIYRCH